jgi:acyl-coenzyme A thioesterase PaaI-like protein
MSGIIDLLREARSTKNFSLLMAAIPYARYLGLSFDELDGERLGKLTYNDSLIGNPALPALHGGTVGALLESTATFELLWTAETIVLPKIITVTVDYLRSAGPRDTFAKGEVTKQGRRVATVHAKAWQEDRARPVAAAVVHLLLTPPE